MCILQQQLQKFHEQGILPKNLQIDRSFFVSCRTHFVNYFVSLGFLCVWDAGSRGNKIIVGLKNVPLFL